MAGTSRIWIVFSTMLVAALLLFSRGESGVAWAQSAPTSCSTSTSTSTSSSTSSPTLNHLNAAAWFLTSGIPFYYDGTSALIC